jgi:hypothetical protein
MRAVAAAALFVPALGMAACGAAEGSVGGQVYQVGGPNPTRGDVGGTVEARRGGLETRTTGTHGRSVPPTEVVTTQTVEPGDYFNFRLKAGVYTLVYPKGGCFVEVTVKTGSTVTQDVVCGAR